MTEVLWFFSVPPGECQDITSNYATTDSFQILSSSLFTYRYFIRRYIVRVAEKASLNKNTTTKQIYCIKYVVEKASLNKLRWAY
jgi:hypothetical protein